MLPGMRSSRPITLRCIWALLAAIHAPALLEVWRTCFTSSVSGDRLGACFALTLSMVFFALKVMDVTFLRLRPGMRSWIAMSLAVALIHLDVIRPDGQVVFSSETAIILATTSAAAILPRLLRASAFPGTSSTNTGKLSLRTCGTIWLDEHLPHCPVLSDRLFLLRAPPA